MHKNKKQINQKISIFDFKIFVLPVPEQSEGYLFLISCSVRPTCPPMLFWGRVFVASGVSETKTNRKN
ncbi:MAG TPA: hypothetical protein DIW44_13365 [Anaerolineaceae bacterium]|nr:hypothetical protein [Anaerolineaceae bacterium]